MKYYHILKDAEADEEEYREGQAFEKACWALSPQVFFAWFLLGWGIITGLCLLIGALL